MRFQHKMSQLIHRQESNLPPRRSLFGDRNWGEKPLDFNFKKSYQRIEEVPILFNFFMLFAVVLLTLELVETRGFQMQTIILRHYQEWPL